MAGENPKIARTPRRRGRTGTNSANILDKTTRTPGGLTKAQPYTVATLPLAAKNNGAIVYVSNGAAGAPCLAYSNGTNWLRVLIGAAVATV